jgi:hypothetical protein
VRHGDVGGVAGVVGGVACAAGVPSMLLFVSRVVLLCWRYGEDSKLIYDLADQVRSRLGGGGVITYVAVMAIWRC